ncbi:MAG: polyphenol oxidase family protein [Thermodesulfobacteriota bacterium]
MIRVNDNGLTYYRFELEPLQRLAHGVFTRRGGVSLPPLDGLNLAFLPGDSEESVRFNLDLAAQALGLQHLAFARQVHGDQALVVRAGDGYRPRRAEEVVPGYDALITPDPGIGLLVKLADCQGVILFDTRNGVVAVVHAGWRGSVKNVLGRTVTRLETEFGCRPADLAAGIGPSLGPCCAEFVNYRRELPPDFWSYRSGDHFDFWSISRDQLVASGLKPENIEIAGLCTKCGADGEFYSYRREKETGRFGLIAGRLGD